MKIYIIADMEGVSGVVTGSQTGGQSNNYEIARKQYTREVNTVCKAALENGVEEIFVEDFHGDGLGLISEQLPEDVTLVRGSFRARSGYDFLDKTFSGVVLLGAHAKAGTNKGVIPHTYNDRVTYELFGQPLGEFDVLSLIAGEMKVPTILVSGDSTAIGQAKTSLTNTPMVITKYPSSCSSAACLHPDKVCRQLAQETARAIKNIDKMELPQITPPALLTIKVNDVNNAGKIDWIPGLERKSELCFEYSANSMTEIANIIYGTTLLV